MKFLLDTNFFMIPGKFKVDVFSELGKFGRPELYTLTSVVKELEKLSKTGTDKGNAKLGLELLKKNRVEILVTDDYDADSGIERVAVEEDFVVCTQDKELIKRLKKEEIRVISLRQKKYLEFWTG